MVHGPHTIQIAYDDPHLGPLALGGIDSSETAVVAQAWRKLGTTNRGGRWHARLFDEHRTVLEERSVDPREAERLIGRIADRLARARDAAAVML